jgi:hypothetical protein
VIYFIAQNGLVSRRPIRSNFYVYRLPEACLAKIELAVNEARIGDGGLVYDKEFLVWLEGQDTAWDQKDGLDE